MFKKKKKCGVCGYRFAPQKEEIYTAEEPRSIAECFSKPPTRFSAVDCPRCGCQIALAIRVPHVTVPPTIEKDEPDESEETEQ